MIARAITSKGSLAGLMYQTNENKSEYSEVYNLSSDDPRENWQEMKTITNLNLNTQKPIAYHVISPSKEANSILQNEDYKKIAEQYSKEMGFYDNQWRFDVHKNTDDVHIHIVSNRINFNGINTVKAGRIGMKAGNVIDKIAKEKGLRTAKEIAKEKKQIIEKTLIQNIKISKTWEEVQSKMESDGYKLDISKNQNGINGARIIPLTEIKTNPSKREVLAKKGYKLSDINRNLKIKQLDNQLKLNRESKRDIRTSNEKGRGIGY